jgi:hypothetical protein
MTADYPAELCARALRSGTRLLGVVFAVALYVVVSVCGVDAGTPEPSDGQPSIRVLVIPDKLVVREGDRIAIGCVIENISRDRVRMLATMKMYAVSNLTLSDPSGNELSAFTSVKLHIPPLKRADFKDLMPRETIEFPFSARLWRTAIVNLGRGPKEATGLFLDFGNSAILIPGPGRYELRLVLDHGREVIEGISTEFGVMDVWYGKIVSPPVEFVVK